MHKVITITIAIIMIIIIIIIKIIIKHALYMKNNNIWHEKASLCYIRPKGEDPRQRQDLEQQESLDNANN